jgi:hypothetical protein
MRFFLGCRIVFAALIFWGTPATAVTIEVIDPSGSAIHVDSSSVKIVNPNIKNSWGAVAIYINGQEHFTSMSNALSAKQANPSIIFKALLDSEKPSVTEDSDSSVDSQFNRFEGEIPSGFVVHTESRINPYDIGAFSREKALVLKLISPANPSVRESWYEVEVDGIKGLFIDSHSLNLISPYRRPDGTYEFKLDGLPNTPRTLDVQVNGVDVKIEMEDIAYVDPLKKNAWGGVLVATKDGMHGYTAPLNIPKLNGIPFQRVVDVDDASVALADEQLLEPVAPEAKPARPRVHGSREFPAEFFARLNNPDLVNLKGNAKDPGYGNINRDYTNMLQDGTSWTVKPMCNLHKAEICKAFQVNGTPKPSRSEFLAVQAIAYQESHMDPHAFRYERKFASKSPAWISRGFDKYTQANPDLDYATRFRMYHTSYGLMQVFLPVLSEWYPVDPEWKNARKGGAADVREIVDHPARLLDPTTNFIWGIRIMRKNLQRAQGIAHPANAHLTSLAKMAAAFNGGAGSLRYAPPTVSYVGCRKGIDQNCQINGARRVPYYEAIESLSAALRNQCNVPSSPCEGVQL